MNVQVSNRDRTIAELDAEIQLKQSTVADLDAEIRSKHSIASDFEQKITKYLYRLHTLEAGINASVYALDAFKKIHTFLDSLGHDLECDAFFEFLDGTVNHLRSIDMSVKAIWMGHSATLEQQKQYAESIGKTLEEVQQPLTDPLDLLDDGDRIVLVDEA